MWIEKEEKWAVANNRLKGELEVYVEQVRREGEESRGLRREIGKLKGVNG